MSWYDPGTSVFPAEDCKPILELYTMDEVPYTGSLFYFKDGEVGTVYANPSAIAKIRLKVRMSKWDGTFKSFISVTATVCEEGVLSFRDFGEGEVMLPAPIKAGIVNISQSIFLDPVISNKDRCPL